MLNNQAIGLKYSHDSNCLKVKEHFKKFLQEYFISDDQLQPSFPYKEELLNMHTNGRKTIFINGPQLLEFDGHLYDFVIKNYYKVEPYLQRAVSELLVQIYQNSQKMDISIAFNEIPEMKIRELRANKVGKLQSLYGTVTRTGQVLPELAKGNFMCQLCGKIVENVEQQFKYTEPIQCPNNCVNKNKWTLVFKDSLFNDFQKVKVQEDSSEIPAGSMPRTVEVILRNDMCERIKPGDKSKFIGQLIVVPDIMSVTRIGELSVTDASSKFAQTNINQDGVLGLKALGQKDLKYKFVFMANNVFSSDNRFNEISNEKDQVKQFTTSELHEIEEISKTQNLYDKLSQSLCPSVYGHDEIKKGMLLQLIGGCHKKTQSGLSLRGDINICIVGDPATAKSQFLKYINNFLPRSIYTSGKATSSAGLTASVTRDPDTGETCIEAGALMLADHGICCIDEFDKMESRDQVAIHEAMEQQTISITKAGIQATLNARTSIFAAANPIFGRYDKSKSLKFNLQMSAPLMSRFDLFFVVLDECNEIYDNTIATYIITQHRGILEEKQRNLFNRSQMQRYIKFARTQIQPQMTKEAAVLIQKKYVQLRLNDVSQKSSYRITVRQLESIIRMSEALARLHLDTHISDNYVVEACRLLQTSILRIEKPDIVFDQAMDLQNVGKGNIIQQEVAEKEMEEKIKAGKLKLTYQQFENVAYFVVNFVKEKLSEPQDENLIQDIAGVKQKDIAEAYVSQLLQNDQISSVEESTESMKIIYSVIQRLVVKENILIVVSGQEFDYDNRKLILHPNYVDEI